MPDQSTSASVSVSASGLGSGSTLFDSIASLGTRDSSTPKIDRFNPLSAHHPSATFPLFNSVQHKRRRWPLVLRFYKGAIHGAVFIPVVLHSAFAAVVVCFDSYIGEIGLPNSIITSLSIVVGLLLVFRNQTSYDRFWTGRNLLTECCTCVRNLTRSFLVSCGEVRRRPLLVDDEASLTTDLEFKETTRLEQADTERTIRVLVAIMYAIKHNLRHEYLFPDQVAPSNTLPLPASCHPELSSLLPSDVLAHEHHGLSLPLQLAVTIEAYIHRGVARNWFHGPQASQLTVQLNNLTAACGRMEAICTTPIPVAHLIHMKQILALYGAVLPFSLVDGFGWWSVPVIAVLMFTLYGIDGIGEQLEDPFGYDKNDIRVDGIVEDARVECFVLLDMWKRSLTKGKVDWMFF